MDPIIAAELAMSKPPMDMEAVIRYAEENQKQRQKEAAEKENAARAREALSPGDEISIDAAFTTFDKDAPLPCVETASTRKRRSNGTIIFKPWAPKVRQSAYLVF